MHMKKLLLIPTALITVLTPAISLVGCNEWHIPPAPEGSEIIQVWQVAQDSPDQVVLSYRRWTITENPTRYRAIIDFKNLEYQDYNVGWLAIFPTPSEFLHVFPRLLVVYILTDVHLKKKHHKSLLVLIMIGILMMMQWEQYILHTKQEVMI